MIYFEDVFDMVTLIGLLLIIWNPQGIFISIMGTITIITYIINKRLLLRNNADTLK